MTPVEQKPGAKQVSGTSCVVGPDETYTRSMMNILGVTLDIIFS